MQSFRAPGDKLALMLVGLGHDEGIQIAALQFLAQLGNPVRVRGAPLQAVVQQCRADTVVQFVKGVDDVVATVRGDQRDPCLVIICGGRRQHTAQNFPGVDHIGPGSAVSQQAVQIPI